jgi:hypothetical protein
MSLVTLIWNPQRSRSIDPTLPEFNCPIRFPIIQKPDPKAAKNGSTQELEVFATDTLIPGTNFIKETTWEQMQNHPFIKKFIDSGAIHVVLPQKQEGVESTGTTLDFSEIDAREIVAQSVDIDWLKQCISAEAANAGRIPNRDSQKMIDACQKQIKQIESSARKMAAAATTKTGDN